MTLPHSAAALHEHAKSSARLRSNRPHFAAWLRALNFSTAEQLFDAVAGRDPQATALLLSEYRRGVPLASTVLIGAKVVMLTAVARHAPGDCLDDRFQATLEAFLSHALPRVQPNHKYADAQLYWITLRTVTRQHRDRVTDIPAPNETFDNSVGDDVTVDIDSYMTGGFLLDWALAVGVLSEFEHRALGLRFGGETAQPVREVAARIGVSEDSLESRLRRATARLRVAASENRHGLERACVAARWAADEIRVPAKTTSGNDVIGVAA